MHGSRAGPHLSTGDDYREGHTIVSVLNHTPVSALRKKHLLHSSCPLLNKSSQITRRMSFRTLV